MKEFAITVHIFVDAESLAEAYAKVFNELTGDFPLGWESASAQDLSMEEPFSEEEFDAARDDARACGLVVSPDE